MRYFLSLIGALFLLFAAQTAVLRMVGDSTVKSESNYFSSLARIQCGVRNIPEIMCLGSSLTGRLPDRTRGIEGVANLGCDGGSAADVLRPMDEGLLPAAPILVVEGNTLTPALARKDSEISRAIHSEWFRVGLRVPNLGASARPAAFLYSTLINRRLDARSAKAGGGFAIRAEMRVPPRGDPGDLSPADQELLEDLSGIVERLRKRGVRVVVAVYPQGAHRLPPRRGFARILASCTGTEFIDTTEGLDLEKVGFTDGVHMDRTSARVVMNAILREISALN